MSESPIFVKKSESIATICFNRPEKRNAINLAIWESIPVILAELADDPSVKVVVIRGVDETAFASGADISEFKAHRSTPEGAKRYSEKVRAAEEALERFPKPTIAMIQRFCIGGGCEIAMACDLRFSSDNGVFGITPAKLGIIYSPSATRNLVNIVGPSRAKDILFSGRLLDAQEAYQFGLIDRVYPDEEVAEKTYEYARLLCQRAQMSIQGAKRIINGILAGMDDHDPSFERLILASYESEDYREGVRAFLEKRPPRFK